MTSPGRMYRHILRHDFAAFAHRAFRPAVDSELARLQAENAMLKWRCARASEGPAARLMTLLEPT
jgi:hypothetical protein